MSLLRLNGGSVYEPLREFFRHIQQVSAELQYLKATYENENLSDSRIANMDSIALAIESLHTAEVEIRQQYEQVLESQQQVVVERERYYDLFYGAPDAYIVTNTYGAIQEVNSLAEALLNVAAPFLLHKPLALYIVAKQRRAFRTFLYDLSRGEARSLHQEELFAVQSRHYKVPIPVAVRAVPMRDKNDAITGIRWLLRDISVQTQIQNELNQTNETLRSLLDASPLAIIALNREGQVQLWNKAAETLFGWSQAEVLGQLPPHIPAGEARQFWEYLNALSTVPILETETIRTNRAREPLPVRLVAAPLCNADGSVVGSIGILADLRDEYENRAALRTIKAKLTNIRDEERRRLARDLHDDVIQKLIGLQFYLTHLRKQLAPPTTEPAKVHLAGLVEIGDEIATVVRILRAILSDLRPPGLEAFGLKEALETYIGQCRQAWLPPVPQINLQVPAELPVVPMSVAQVVMRVAQEGLSNVRRHADANTVKVALSVTTTHVTLTIQDDGKGFQLPHHITIFATAGHFGLLGIMEQVEGIGGFLEIRSESGQGTLIRAVMTLPPDDK